MTDLSYWLLPLLVPLAFGLGCWVGYKRGKFVGWAERAIIADQDEQARLKRRKRGTPAQ